MTTHVEGREALLEQGWAALPAAYRPPALAPSLAEAHAWCRRLTETHYENFHVASRFLPERLREHFYPVYAFCRVSDDLGDEVGDPGRSLALLNWWGEQLSLCFRGEAAHPVFVALRQTALACDLPEEPFADLLTAFRRDQTVTRYKTIEDLLDYCRYSANPVGRIVLMLAGYRDEERFRLSDHTCTALQLANHWQDVRVDLQKGRVYLPEADRVRFKVAEAMLHEPRANEAVRSLIRYEVGYARVMFHSGLPLVRMVDRELAVDLDLFSRGGLAILDAIERQGCDVLAARPKLGKARKAGLLLRAIAHKYTGLGRA